MSDLSPTMGIAEALDIMIARTGHTRYRDLCNPVHPDFSPAYVRLVVHLAGRGDIPSSSSSRSSRPPRPHLSNGRLLDLIQRIHACPHWTKSDCGCHANRCAIGKGEGGRVTIEDCRECLDGR